MFERLIYEVLDTGMRNLIARPTRISRFLVQRGIAADEAVRLRDFVVANPPAIIHSYPRLEDARFPLLAIVLGTEGEARKFLDDSGGMLASEDLARAGLGSAFLGAEIGTSVVDAEFHVLVLTRGPDITLAYYQLAKLILSVGRAHFKQQGALAIRMSGADLEPNRAYAPHDIFVRRLTLAFSYEEPVWNEREDTDDFRSPFSSGPRIRSVDGILVNDGQPSESFTGVTPYTPDDGSDGSDES